MKLSVTYKIFTMPVPCDILGMGIVYILNYPMGDKNMYYLD